MALFKFLKKKRAVEKNQSENKVTNGAPDPKDEKNIKEKTAPVFRAASRQAHGVLVEPHITERTNEMAILRKYVFKISSRSNKASVKRAIEELYKVTVNHVNIISVPSKKRKRGLRVGHRPGFKKAIVTLAPSDKIELV